MFHTSKRVLLVLANESEGGKSTAKNSTISMENQINRISLTILIDTANCIAECMARRKFYDYKGRDRVGRSSFCSYSRLVIVCKTTMWLFPKYAEHVWARSPLNHRNHYLVQSVDSALFRRVAVLKIPLGGPVSSGLQGLSGRQTAETLTSSSSSSLAYFSPSSFLFFFFF